MNFSKRMGLWAPDEYWDLTQDQIGDISNGCGPKTKLGILARLVPDTFIGLKITPACDIHDFCFYYGVPFNLSNIMFFFNMASVVTSGRDWKWLVRWRCRRVAIYYLAVSGTAGSIAYNDEKSKAMLLEDWPAELRLLRSEILTSNREMGKLADTAYMWTEWLECTSLMA